MRLVVRNIDPSDLHRIRCVFEDPSLDFWVILECFVSAPGQYLQKYLNYCRILSDSMEQIPS